MVTGLRTVSLLLVFVVVVVVGAGLVVVERPPLHPLLAGLVEALVEDALSLVTLVSLSQARCSLLVVRQRLESTVLTPLKRRHQQFLSRVH
jgi:hypothetical protein